MPLDAGDGGEPMFRRPVMCLAFLSTFLIAGCGGDGDEVDQGSGFLDVIIVFDTAGEDTNQVGDSGGRDHSISVDQWISDNDLGVDPGQDDPGTQDPGSVDEGGGNDPGTVDDPGQSTDEGIEDTNTGEDAIQDNHVPDEDISPVDTADPVDMTDPPDVNYPDCTGSCTYGTDEMFCSAAGRVCQCSQSGTWTEFVCSTVCGNEGMIGDSCLTSPEGGYCACEFDCTDTVLVTQQCTNLLYTPCTCSAADPCEWQHDDYCDKLCEIAYPDDFFPETWDCDCAGTCSATSFGEFCDNQGGTCSCESGLMVSTNCVDWCSDLGAALVTDEWCYQYSVDEQSPTQASCACENWNCGNASGVTAQCGELLYTPCTCAASNPCGWIGDGFCDSVNCDQLFPDQINFDDSSSDC